MDYPASGNLPMEQQASQVFAIERNHVLVVEPSSMFRQLWKPFLEMTQHNLPDIDIPDQEYGPEMSLNSFIKSAYHSAQHNETP